MGIHSTHSPGCRGLGLRPLRLPIMVSFRFTPEQATYPNDLQVAPTGIRMSAEHSPNFGACEVEKWSDLHFLKLLDRDLRIACEKKNLR